ncbi:MAG TPA: hypothetical protein VG168_07895 [Bryobacteraceae bacterium]|nr:hypothetical protein [Bryobacteraceae bacterium]
MVRTFSIVSVLFLLATAQVLAQDAATGLGRIYIQPVNGSFEKLLGFEIVHQHIPVVLVDSPKSADCVLGWTTVPGVAGRTDFVLVDRQTRAVTWEFSASEAKMTSSKRKVPQKVTAQIVHSLAKAGAYCGGAAFSAPTQSADQRAKAFKPPTFNW